MRETWIGYKQAVEHLTGLRKMVKGGPSPAAGKDVIKMLRLPGECEELDDDTDRFRPPDEVTHEEIVHRVVEQYMAFFYCLPMICVTTTVPGKAVQFSSHVKWLANQVRPIIKEAYVTEAGKLALTTHVGWVMNEVKPTYKAAYRDKSNKCVRIKIANVPPTNFGELICREMLGTATLDDFLKEDVGGRGLETLERSVFECLLRASCDPQRRVEEHWKIVWLFLEEEVRLLTTAQECLDFDNPKVLPLNVVTCLTDSIQLGEIRASHTLGPNRSSSAKWRFDWDFKPKYVRHQLSRNAQIAPMQVHLAKLITAKTAFHLCQALQDFSSQLDSEDRKKYRYICQCQLPECGQSFFSGHRDQKVCGSRTGYRSDCQRRLDNLRRAKARSKQ